MASVYTVAAVCKRGHALTRDVGRIPAAKRCPDCGAVVLTACPSCDAPIRGVFINTEIVAIGFPYDPPDFCEDCGAPFPWVGRQGRIYELENLIDEQRLDPADELAVREQLRALASDDLDDEEQARRWQRVKRLAPGLLQTGAAERIFESVATAAIRQQFGL